MASVTGQKTLAFGVDPTRQERYSLRQSRYYAISEDVSRLAGQAAEEGRRLDVFDMGVNWGVSRRYLEAQPHGEVINFSGADLKLRERIHRQEDWVDLFTGNLMEGYPQVPSNRYDVVICEQVLEHLPELEVAAATLGRILKPGGTLFLGVPIFPPGIQLIRKHVVPAIDRLNPRAKVRGHVQAFTRGSIMRVLTQHAGVEVQQTRGFRIASGGLLRPLENYQWWYRLNRQMGAIVPGLCTEIQIVAKKPLAADEQGVRGVAARAA